MKAVAVLILLAFAVPVKGQSYGGADPRFKSIEFSSGTTFDIPTSPDTSQTILFASGERIQSVILSDPSAYLVTVAGSADGIALRANGYNALAIMTVRTDRRTYLLELTPSRRGPIPQVLTFTYNTQSTEPVSPGGPPPVSAATYRFKGSKALRPQSVTDDNAKTYITWSPDQAMPAVFGIGPTGKEEAVNGYVRGGVFTIDRVYPKLLFRIDKDEARAFRKMNQGRKPA